MTTRYARLVRWLAPPSLPEPDGPHLVRVVHTLALVLIGVLFIPTLLRPWSELGRPIFFALTAQQLVVVAAFVMNRRGNTKGALLLILVGLLGLVTFIVATSDDGFHDIALLVLPALLVISSLLLDGRLFALFSAAAIGIMATMAGLEVSGVWTNAMSPYTTIYDMVEGSMILAVTALSVGLLIQNIKQSLERARTSEAALGRSHAALQRQTQKLVESEARYRLVVETAQDPIVSTDLNGRFVFVNGSAARMAGYAIEDMIGMQFFDFCLPEERDRVRRAFFRQVHDRDENRSYEVSLRSRTGRIHWLNLSVSLELREYALSGFHVVARDITERRVAEAEVRRLNQELERRVQDRTAELEATMNEMQKISYTVSHDLRAPLRHISAYAEMSQTRPSVRDDAHAFKYLQTIGFSAKWMGMLVDGLIEYLSIGQTVLHSTGVDLAQLTADVIRELAPETAGRTIDWKVGSLPVVEGDRRLLRQALHNLIMNAVKFTQVRPHAVIEIGVAPVEGTIREHWIYVRDNGVGFDPQYQERLFGLFERLHSRAEHAGAGIGLANVRRIIHRHGGRVWAEGAVDRGATFTFTMPHHVRTTDADQPAVSGPRPGAAVETP